MNAPATSSQDIFDVRKIRRLVELMKEHDLTRDRSPAGRSADSTSPRRRRSCRRSSVFRRPCAAAGAAGRRSAGAGIGRPAPRKPIAKHIAVIKSPMVGTFYAAPDPDSPPFVKVGDHVGPETTVCIVEAMKVFNQIPAEVSGRIVAVLAENGAPVEFGQPLFKVDTRE